MYVTSHPNILPTNRFLEIFLSRFWEEEEGRSFSFLTVCEILVMSLADVKLD